MASQTPTYSFKVAAVQNNNLAMTNCVFVSSADSSKLCSARNPVSFVQLSDGIVYPVRVDPSVNAGELAFNKLQRTVSGLSSGLNVSVSPFIPSRDRNLNLSLLRLEVDLLGKAKAALEEDALVEFIRESLSNFVFCSRQELCVDFRGTPLKFKVLVTEVADLGQEDEKKGTDSVGFVMGQTNIFVEAVTPPNKLLTLKKSQNTVRTNIFSPTFRFEDMGIGGLDKEFGDIFRRAFASRTFPPALVRKLGIRHVKGILLYGPPGTGKTLIARQIGKMLHGREPKIVNGPEILNKYVGQSEENIRKLFAEAEEDQEKNGDDSDLHIIIFDEIDAICKQRGSVTSSAGVHDTVVNQLLSKLDGVNALNNVLVIGMTNRKELIDEALLRPGRFEVHVEIGLPDMAGRMQILKIHTRRMADNGFLGNDIDLPLLSERTKNFSGAELEGLVKSAASYAFYGSIDVTKDSVMPKNNLNDMKVSMEHFERALREVKPAFGVEEEELRKYLRGGFVNYGADFDHLLRSCQVLVEQVRNSPRTPLLSILLQGGVGCGKTAFATFLAMNSAFPFVKMVSAEDMVGWSEHEKASRMAKIFRDAYKSPLSIIIVDEIERLLEYVNIGPRFSNSCLQTLLVLLKKVPPQDGRKLMVIGTTSNPRLLDQMQFRDAFNVVFEVPQVQPGPEIRNVFLSMQSPIDEPELDQIEARLTQPIGIKQLLMVIEMATQNSDNGKITADRFFDCLRDCGFFRGRNDNESSFDF